MKKVITAAVLGGLFVLVFPFMLDWLYGIGFFVNWNNSFPADTWFSFIGSYFPAAIIGILTLYQASIIQEQERRYKKLLDRHRFMPDGHVHVYRFDKNSHAIGQYDFNEIRKMFVRSGQKHLLEEWESGYIIECNIYNASNIEINQARGKKIEWKINGKVYEQQSSERMCSVVNKVSHSRQQVVIFWLFDESEKAGDEIAQCMNNEFRINLQYETSDIAIDVQIADDDGEISNLKMQYRLQALNDTYKMSSIEENYFVS